MARMVLTALLIVLVNVLVGCNEVDTIAKLRQVEPQAQQLSVPQAGEVDIAEHVATSRQAYRNGLQALVDYYTDTGNNMKLEWAKKELNLLKKVTQYDYIVEAAVPGTQLRASQSILEADYIFRDIVKCENQARLLCP